MKVHRPTYALMCCGPDDCFRYGPKYLVGCLTRDPCSNCQ